MCAYDYCLDVRRVTTRPTFFIVIMIAVKYQYNRNHREGGNEVPMTALTTMCQEAHRERLVARSVSIDVHKNFAKYYADFRQNRTLFRFRAVARAVLTCVDSRAHALDG